MELTAGEIWSRMLEGARQALPEQAFRRRAGLTSTPIPAIFIVFAAP